MNAGLEESRATSSIADDDELHAVVAAVTAAVVGGHEALFTDGERRGGGAEGGNRRDAARCGQRDADRGRRPGRSGHADRRRRHGHGVGGGGGSGRGRAAVFTVALSDEVASEVTVEQRTVDLTAMAGEDHIAVTATANGGERECQGVP